MEILRKRIEDEERLFKGVEVTEAEEREREINRRIVEMAEQKNQREKREKG